ncbi:MAG: hypothetical protein WD490_03605 [Opitutales bacterium]
MKIKIKTAAVLLLALAGAFSGTAFADENVAAREVRERADQAMRAEEWPEADKVLAEGLRANPASPELWVGRGFTQNRLGDMNEARKSFQNALKLYRGNLKRQPDHPGWIMNVGFLLILLDSCDEATRFLAAENKRLPHVEALDDFEEIVAAIEKNFSEWILPAPAEE